jgi:hypothetical protein
MRKKDIVLMIIYIVLEFLYFVLFIPEIAFLLIVITSIVVTIIGWKWIVKS